MRKFKLLLLFVLIVVCSTANGQGSRSEIKGIITDESGNPLEGTSVSAENTFFGTFSATDGSYSLKGISSGRYLIKFSFIGYETQTHELNIPEQTALNITMVRKSFMAGEVIVSSTRAGNNSPLAFTTIDGEIIRKHNTGQDIPFLLGMTPSLVETSEAGNGIGYTNLRIRGTDASRINVTIDGIPLNDPESQQVFWVDLPDLASSVDNIQVQRGVGTSSNGAGAFGATISIQTKNPENEPFAQTEISAGSFGTFKKLIAAGTGNLPGNFALQLKLSEISSDGYIDRTGSDHRSAHVTGLFRTEKSHLKANIILGEEHTRIGWWGVPGEMLSLNRKYNPAGEYTDESGVKQYYNNESDNYFQNHYQLLYSFRLTENLNLNSALHYTDGRGYYEEYKEDAYLPDYGLPAVTIGDTSFFESDLIRRKWMSNDFYGVVYSLKFRKPGIEATFGGGANYYDGDHFGRIIWMKNPGASEKDHQWYLNNGSKSEISVYGKAQFSISERLSLFGDLQYRFINYLMKGNDDDLKDLSQEHQYSFINPKTGIFWSVSPNQDAFLSFSVANREPTRADFKEASGDPGATPGPETLYDIEAGYKLRGEKYSFSANLYGMIYKDQLVPTGELSNVGYPIMTNVGKSHRIGAELSAGIRPFRFITWNFGITLSDNRIDDFIEYYTDYDTISWSAEYKSKNHGTVDIAYSPSITGISDMTITPVKNLELHFISKYVGNQYFDNTMSSNRMLDSYLVNNLRIDFEPRVKGMKSIGFQFLLNNIFNSIYESNAYGGNWYEAGEEKTWSYYFPQAGTNVLFKVSMIF